MNSHQPQEDNEKELQMIWTSADSFEQLRGAESRFRGRIADRDRLETVVALCLVAVFLPTTLFSLKTGEPLITGALALLTLYCLCVPVVLWRSRPRLQPLDLPLADYRREALAGYDRQIKLLKRAWLWYVAPVWVGVMMLFGGVLQKVWPRLWEDQAPGRAWVVLTLIWAPVTSTVMGYFIARANRRAAKRLAEERDSLAQSQLQAADDSADRS